MCRLYSELSGGRESPTLFTHSYVITTPSGQLNAPMTLLTNAAGSFDFVLKYYPNQGMAVTANSASLPHFISTPGYVLGSDSNVNVRWANIFLREAPKCP
jgi:hypothetical protein